MELIPGVAEALAHVRRLGYQLFIVLAATGYVFGVTESKEYAEPEWYIDIWLTIVWMVGIVAVMIPLATRQYRRRSG